MQKPPWDKCDVSNPGKRSDPSSSNKKKRGGKRYTAIKLHLFRHFSLNF